jgi:tetratricopeptide (TPR) repeat protein
MNMQLSPSSRELFDYADALRQVGRFGDAIEIYNPLESIPVPKSKKCVYLFKGDALKEMGRILEAENAFRAACKLDQTTSWDIQVVAVFAHDDGG